MGFINSKYYNLVIAVTLLFALMGLTAANILSYSQIALLAIGTILIGIPHGAADNHVFYQLKKSNNFLTKVKFYSIYLSLIAVVLLCYYAVPNMFLAAFLFHSAFHFGQSNWHYINKNERNILKIIVYLLWGGFVLLTPLLMNYSESMLVINSISPDAENIFEILNEFKYLIISVLFTLNLLVILLFKKNNLLSPKEAVKETITLLS
ncbi:MAG: Brp/Blh family beta-carotene 15,15'-dioxygenase, partial [Ignavibacterium sp.]|uniref:Brp/Blh family beta-carotene 15,15'-dioxygenase n=1 Tax=Ignavibacterium sp. TaxID=2651167 RepID=UPI004049618D